MAGCVVVVLFFLLVLWLSRPDSPIPVPSAFRAILNHTVICALAVLSFIFLFWLTHSGLTPGRLLAILDDTENVVLGVIFVYFALVLIYDLVEERARAVIQFIRQHLILA